LGCLKKKEGVELKTYYRQLLLDLGSKASGAVKQIIMMQKVISMNQEPGKNH